MSFPTPKVISLAVPLVDTTAGAAKDVSHMSDMKVQFTGTFVADMAVQASNDGTNFYDVDANTTAPGVVDLGVNRYAYLRIYQTNYTSGTPLCTVFGIERLNG